MKLHGKKIFFMQNLQILACTLSDDVSTIVTPPKFQCWIKLQRLTCIASHWVAHLRHRFQRLIHIQVSNNVTNIIESSNLSVVLKKKPNLYKCGFICSILTRPFNCTQIILKMGVTTIFASLLDYRNCNNNHRFINCEHTTGMLENQSWAWHWLSNEDYMQMNFKLQ